MCLKLTEIVKDMCKLRGRYTQIPAEAASSSVPNVVCGLWSSIKQYHIQKFKFSHCTLQLVIDEDEVETSPNERHLAVKDDNKMLSGKLKRTCCDGV